MLEILRHPRGVGALVWIYALGMMAFMAMNGVLALYLERRFGINEKTIGWFFVYVGGISLIMRTLVLGPMVRRFGEIGVMRAGALSMALSLAIFRWSQLRRLAFAVLLMPVGTAFSFPPRPPWSRDGPREQTGLVLGVHQSFGGVARMIGPIWAGGYSNRSASAALSGLRLESCSSFASSPPRFRTRRTQSKRGSEIDERP